MLQLKSKTVILYKTVQEEDGTCRLGRNDKINEMSEGHAIVRFIKSETAMAETGPEARRYKINKENIIMEADRKTKKRRLRKRWLEDDLKTMNVRQLTRKAQDRSEWKAISRKAKTQQGYDALQT